MKSKRNLCISRTQCGRWAIQREGDAHILHEMIRQEDARELAWDVAAHEGVQVIMQADQPAGPAPLAAGAFLWSNMSLFGAGRD